MRKLHGLAAIVENTPSWVWLALLAGLAVVLTVAVWVKLRNPR
jgi:hypothetical protein